MKEFEAPEMRYVAYAAKDILTSSEEDPTAPTEKPRPSDFTTPEDDFEDEPAG